MSTSIQELCRAVAQNTSYDAFAPAFNAQQWETLGSYLQPFDLSAGQVLIDQGAHDRTLFFIERGALSVHMLGSQGQMRLAILNLGYADGYLRAFAGHGAARLGERTLPLVGRVSMDLVAIDISDAGIGEGDWLEVDYRLETAAAATGLSQYELLTGLGSRYQRRWTD